MADGKPLLAELVSFKPPTLTARYAPVMWEPVAGTGEKIVALICVEPHGPNQLHIDRATYPVLSQERLRQLLGRQRAASATGVLEACASFMTERQRHGSPIVELRPLFQSFTVGPAMVARANSVPQLLDAAVRSVSAFGSAEQIAGTTRPEALRHTIRTAEFLRAIKTTLSSSDSRYENSFDVPLTLAGVEDITIDFAAGPLLVQMTSLAATKRQADRTKQEVQSKIFELDLARREMSEAGVQPALLINMDAMSASPSSEPYEWAARTHERVKRVAEASGVRMFEAPSILSAVEWLGDAASAAASPRQLQC